MELDGLCAPDEMLCLVCVSLLTVCDAFPLHVDPCCIVHFGSKELRAESNGAFGDRDQDKERKGNVLAAASTDS